MRREFLQLATPYKADKHQISGLYVSEKLDGTRCFWDGGLSRGQPTDSVPWASIIDPKTGKRKKKIKPVSSGLWSRYGNPILAPDEFLNKLPCCPLDGELWAGRGNFQLCRSICGGDEPDPRFMDQIAYAVYSSPSWDSLFATGEIKNTNMVCSINLAECEEWLQKRYHYNPEFKSMERFTFQKELEFMAEAIPSEGNDHIFMHLQHKLPDDETAARQWLDKFLNQVLKKGGEGVVMRVAKSVWTPKRHVGILKWKPIEDDEGRIIGYTSGRETDKGSKLLGMIGAVILDYKGQRLEISGFTDEERLFANEKMTAYAAQHPDEDMPDWFQGKHFKKGEQLTFKYRELTDKGIPKEARYFRKRDVE